MKYPRQIDIHFTRQSDEAAGPYGDVFNCRVASAVKHSLPEDLREKFVSAGTNTFTLGTAEPCWTGPSTNFPGKTSTGLSGLTKARRAVIRSTRIERSIFRPGHSGRILKDEQFRTTNVAR